MSNLSIKSINIKKINNKGYLQWDYSPFLNFSIVGTYDVDSSNYTEQISNDYGYIFEPSENGTYLLSNTGKYEEFTKDGDMFIIAGHAYDIIYCKDHFATIGENLVKYVRVDLCDPNALVDFNTVRLQFDALTPEIIDVQASYDGSVNLIINDGEHAPKLINSRFSPIGDGQYEIIDRVGTNDTNIYHEATFDSDTSLFKTSSTIPKINFLGVYGNGSLPVGNYVFYFTLSDEDGNETDFIGESSIVTCHKGGLTDPFSTDGGVVDENSHKLVKFRLTNLDSSYAKVKVFFSRQSCTADGTLLTSYGSIDNLYEILGESCDVTISGFESKTNLTVTDINPAYTIILAAKALAIVSNMLFLGNIKLRSEDYETLRKMSLFFCPKLGIDDIGYVNNEYEIEEFYATGKEEDKIPAEKRGEYYNVFNIYNRTGYWNDELYRFGIVYIYNDGSQSAVYNTRGYGSASRGIETWLDDENGNPTDPYTKFGFDTQFLEKDHFLYGKDGVTLTDENDMGVVRIKYNNTQLKNGITSVLGIQFILDNTIKTNVYKTLNDLGIIGYYFVRQKRLATILCEAITLGYDKQSHLPLLYDGEYFTESFIDKDSRKLVHDFNSRLRKTPNGSPGRTAISPEYEQKLTYYNSIFTASSFPVTVNTNQYEHDSLGHNGLHFYPESDTVQSLFGKHFNVYLQAVPGGTSAIKNFKNYYSSRAGEPAEAFRISKLFNNNTSYSNSNITRGMWGPYLGIEYAKNKHAKNLLRLDIRIPDYSVSNMTEYFKLRFEDPSPFYPISDRMDLSTINNGDFNTLTYFRGDCYICNYTHRVCRNFLDPSFPINDEILDPDCWTDGYKLQKSSKLRITFKVNDDSMLELNSENQTDLLKINRADVNAINMGHWVTFKVFSTINLSMRSSDTSLLNEYAVTHRPRGFYPLFPMSTAGTDKIEESFLFNEGYGKTTGERMSVTLAKQPYYKNNFKTRIAYSDLSVNDSFKNNMRVFRKGNSFDYPTEYGQIVALKAWSDNLICVFEHAVALIAVNEKVIATNAATSTSYIKTDKVISDTLTILSKDFGSLWPESIITTPTGIYGVDTVQKKIWLCTSNGFAVLSDLSISQFLNRNITLNENETLPIIGIRNVKTHYNANKLDVMFTFYDDISSLDETAWNICYNELNKKFITFYSWIPSYSENINKVYFSFDRETSKNIACLNNVENHIIAKNNVIDLSKNEDYYDIPITYIKTKLTDTEKQLHIGEYYTISIVDNYRSQELIDIKCKQNNTPFKAIYDNETETLQGNDYTVRVHKKLLEDLHLEKIPIKITTYIKKENNLYLPNYTLETNIYTCNKEFLEKQLNYFWKHGLSGLMKLDTEIKPTNWYGQQHPFEFEFLVNAADSPGIHKVFESLIILSNKAKPESFHFEIIGENYNFADDKKNMFWRQEATKHFYLYNGGNIAYNSEYMNITPQLRYNEYYQYNDKSTIFPLYVSHVDRLNLIYDIYQKLTSSSYDYESLSGSEIVYDKLVNEFRIATHMPAYPIDGSKEVSISQSEYEELRKYNLPVRKSGDKYYKLVKYGRRLGNCDYKEDLWYVQIPSIRFQEKNEDSWQYPAVNLHYNPLPEDGLIVNTEANVPSYLSNKINVVNEDWDIKKLGTMKETRLRDRFLKVKIRYSGEDLAIINAITTIYNDSFA